MRRRRRREGTKDRFFPTPRPPQPSPWSRFGATAAVRKDRRKKHMNEEEAQATTPEIPSATPPATSIPDTHSSAEDDFDEQERRELEAMRAQNGFGEATPATNAGIANLPVQQPEEQQEQAAASEAAANPAEPTRKPSVLPKEDPRAALARLRNEMRSKDGKHGRAMETLNRENESLRQQLSELNKRIADLESGGKQAESAPSKPEEMTDEELKKVFGEEDVEINGTDSFRAMLKAAQYVLSRTAAKGASEEDVAKLVEAKIADIRKQSRLESVMDELEREMPGYRQLNEQADVNGFGRYLNGKFPGTEFTLREVAENALSRVVATARTDKAHAAAMKTLESVVRGFASSRSPKPATTSPAPQNGGQPRFDPSKYVLPRPVSTTPAPKGTGEQRQFTEAQLDAMRAKALAEGEAAYDRFEAMEMELRRTGRVTA